MKNIRKDGKTRKTLFLYCLFAGIFGAHHFYLGQKKLGWITLGISWVSASLPTLLWVLYASIPPNPETFSYNWGVVFPTILFLVPLIMVFIWTMYLSLRIVLGTYKDENKVPVGQWNDNQQDVINYLLNL